MGEYMRERAKTSPHDCMLLNLLQYFTMVVLLRKAEQRNKFTLYLACMRLSLPLLAVANAKNYVHIFTDFLKYWATASDAEKELIEKYGFTLETANGVTISLDYGHEKYVWLVRDSTGNFFRRGSQARIEYAGLCRMEKQKNEGIKTVKTILGEHDYIAGTKRDLKRYDAFALTKLILQFKAMGSFSKFGNRVREPSQDVLHSMHHAGKVLQLDILDVDAIGTQLVSDYLRKYVVKVNPSAKREESNLKKRQFTAGDSEKLCEERVVLAGTTKPAALQKFTVKELLVHLDDIRGHLPEACPVPTLTASSSKSVVVATLAALKPKAFAENPMLRQSLVNAAKSRAYGGALTKDKLCAIVDRPIYSQKLQDMLDITEYEINL